MTEWDIVDALSAGQPWARESLESAFKLPLQEVEGTEDFRFYVGRPGSFGEAMPLVELELRVRRETNQAELVIATLGNTTITSADARQRFAELTITGIPRGRSTEEVTTLSRETPAGKLSLCFKGGKPDRLAQIVFTPLIGE